MSEQERVVFLKDDYVAECDVERLRRLFKDLDDYGLKYNFSTNLREDSEVKGKVVLNDGKEEEKEYQFSFWGANVTKALKSPAFWNSITDQTNGLVRPHLLRVGLATTTTAEAIGRTLDQLSLMWGHSFIERSEPMEERIFEGKDLYKCYTFGLVEDGCTHGNEPKIVFYNRTF